MILLLADAYRRFEVSIKATHALQSRIGLLMRTTIDAGAEYP
jgi:hypothetical protein